MMSAATRISVCEEIRAAKNQKRCDSSNMLLNGGAEVETISGWTKTGGSYTFKVCQTSGSGHCAGVDIKAKNRNWYFYAVCNPPLSANCLPR